MDMNTMAAVEAGANYHDEEALLLAAGGVVASLLSHKHLSFLYSSINCSISAPDQLLVFMVCEFRSNDRFRTNAPNTCKHSRPIRRLTITSL